MRSKGESAEVSSLAKDHLLFNLMINNNNANNDGDKTEKMKQMKRRMRKDSVAMNSNPFKVKLLNKSDEKEPEQKEENVKKPIEIKHAWRLLKKEWKMLAIGTAMSLSSTAASTYSPTVLGDFYDAINCVSLQGALAPGNTICADDVSMATVHHYFLIMILLAVGSLIAGQASSFIFSIAGRRIIARARTDLVASYLRQDSEFFDRRGVGELLSRLSNDTGQFQGLTHIVHDLLGSVGLIAVGLYFMLSISAGLTIIVCSAVPLVSVASLLIGRLIRNWTQTIMKLLAAQSQVSQEILGSMGTVKAYQLESKCAGRYAAAVGHVYQQALRIVWASTAYAIYSSLTTSSVSLLTAYVGGMMVLGGAASSGIFAHSISLGKLFSFTVYSTQLRGASTKLSGLYTSIIKCMTVAGILYSLLERRSVDPYFEGRKTRLPELKGHVAFEDVSFSYPLRPNVMALNHVSFENIPGQMTCLVGGSGSGKSTILNMLLGFRVPTAGRILIDGVDMSEIDVGWLRQCIAYVPQEPVLFSCSIRDNIAFGKIGASEEEIMEAAEAAVVTEFLGRLPDGIDTVVNQGHGSQLSGGQKQRIAIARAFIRSATFLLLDEPTSALDAQSEELVSTALNQLRKGKTTIMSSHKPAAMKAAALIICFAAGKIVETGSPQELAQGSSKLASLLKS